MKTTFKRILIFVALTIVILMQTGITSYAAGNLDEIEDYTITVNVREDGTLDIKYEVVWKVLSDKKGSEPVTWVKVGIPNSHVDTVEAITDNIKEAKYYSSGGDFVRVDFTKEYHEGETFDFAFTIHQTHMYMLEDDSIKYGFTAGWFEDIVVDKITIRWNKIWVAESTASDISEDGKYLVWSGENLPEGEHFSTSVRYPKDTFATDENQQYEERSSGKLSAGWIIVIIIIAVVVIGFLVIIIDDDYGGGSGFGGGRGVFISSCARSSCACASCACACACAGGGRAGCSVKDFYNGKTKVVRKGGPIVTVFNKVLEEDTK